VRGSSLQITFIRLLQGTRLSDPFVVYKNKGVKFGDADYLTYPISSGRLNVLVNAATISYKAIGQKKYLFAVKSNCV
jgi:hypothetical protein